MRLWHRVFFLSLGGMFLAELFVMWFLNRLGIRWGFSGALVDALLLTMLVLPILYFTALQPVSRLAASVATAEADAASASWSRRRVTASSSLIVPAGFCTQTLLP
jgi:hypothetical protein